MQTDYINKQKLLENIQKLKESAWYKDTTWYGVAQARKEGVAAVEEICKEQSSHAAEWRINPDGYYPYCSECGEEPQGQVMTKYCPNCGAAMTKGTTAGGKR